MEEELCDIQDVNKRAPLVGRWKRRAQAQGSQPNIPLIDKKRDQHPNDTEISPPVRNQLVRGDSISITTESTSSIVEVACQPCQTS